VLSAQPSPVLTPNEDQAHGFFDSPSYRASPGTRALATHWRTAPMAPQLQHMPFPEGFAIQQRRNGVALEPFTLNELLEKVKLCEVEDGRAEPA